MRPITNRQKEILNFIIGFIDSKKYPPTIREIGNHFKMTPRGAWDHVFALERKGFVKSSVAGRSRTLTVLKGGIYE